MCVYVHIYARITTRDKRSVSEARTLRADTQSMQALSGRWRSNTVGEGRNSRRRYSRYGYIGPYCDVLYAYTRNNHLRSEGRR